MVQKGTVAKKGTGTVESAYDYVAGVYLNGKKPYIYIYRKIRKSDLGKLRWGPLDSVERCVLKS